MVHYIALVFYPLISFATDIEVQFRLRNDHHRGHLGFCHSVWELKTEKMWNRYGIDWVSPQRKHPNTNFD